MSKRVFPLRRGVSAVRIIIVVVLLAAIGAVCFDYFQKSQRDKAIAAIQEMDINPVRDPNNEKKIIKQADPNKQAAKRKEIHEKVFGGAMPSATTKNGTLMVKESWAYPGVFTTYVVDVTYNLDANSITDEDRVKKEVQNPEYFLLMKEPRDISRFDPEPLIEPDDPTFAKMPNFDEKQTAGEGGGGGGGGSRGQNNNQADDAGAGSGDAGSGDAGSGDAGSGDAGSGDAGSGDSGSGDAGSGDSGSGDAGSGDAGSGGTPIKAPPAGDGNSGSGDAGSGDAGSGGGL